MRTVCAGQVFPGIMLDVQFISNSVSDVVLQYELCTRGHKILELLADVEVKEPAEEMRVPFIMK